jgi:hypothetical protein
MATGISVHRIGKIEAEVFPELPNVVTLTFSDTAVSEAGPVSLDLFFVGVGGEISRRYAEAINAVTAELSADLQQAAE